MKPSPRAPRRALTRVALALACTLAVCLGAAAAAAAPPEPTLTVAQLQALLDAAPGGTLEGYFKTVLKGSDIVQIPVTVRSTVPYSIPEGSLILFQAKGPAIEEIGGIAHGMSGSPLYVVGQGGDKLVGAVSYGDIFTRGYLGLATPVEYMAAMEDTFLPNPMPLALPQPLKVGGATLSHVVVARSAREARTVTLTAGTVVMAPLATVAISGLPPQSAAYKHLAALFEKHGCDVAPYGAQLTGSEPAFTSPLIGGAGVSVLLSRGDVLFSGSGTITWNDGDRVVMFGHPFFGDGDVEFYLANATVNGVWSSNMDPYKVMTPGSVRGSVLQDRGSGLAGRLGDMPVESPVTASVKLQPQGVVGREASFMPRSLFDADWALLAADILAAAGYNASDNAATPGSAVTTTTIVVSDGVGAPSTVVRTNMWDDSYNVLGALNADAATMLSMLVDDPDGTAPATILSVDMTADAGPARTSARIAGARFPSGLKAGATNKVEVTLFAYGQETPITAVGELRLPAGASPSGALSVYPAAVGPSPDDGPESPVGGNRARTAVDDRQTVAQRVAAVRALPTNDQLVVVFSPDLGAADAGVEPVETTLTVSGSYVTGSIQRRTSQLRLRATPASVPYKGAFAVSGTLTETAGETTVDLYKLSSATGEKVKIATVVATPNGRGGAVFSQRLSGWTGNAMIVAEWGGDATALGTSARAAVVVRQAVTLRAGRSSVPVGSAVKLTADVLPGKPGQPVLFERKASGGAWVLLKTVKLDADRSADLIWKPPLGTSSLRARVAATVTNGGARSAPFTITATGR
ncbi:MAG: hypothetical protein NTW58_04995 [Actinobacteria bacterium]|nr:hypothetical protein [Actinomycetota bacterium]